ncbi:hypothetical protein [Agromyces bauzanensis]
MSGTVTAPLVGAIEAAWKAIQAHHEDVPEVVVTLGSGTQKQGMKLGHFAPDRWARGDDRVHELFVGGEGLARGGAGVLGTLLHEAAHGAAQTRGIKDTSRQGRFHNAKFKAIGEEFGLTLDHDQSIGWSVTNVPPPTAARYAVEVAALDAALVAYRIAEPTGAGRKSNNNGVSAQCECGRKIRVSRSVLDAGPIICGVCETPFEAEDE